MNFLFRFRQWLTTPVDGHILGIFRLMFGLFMVYHCFYFHQSEFINKGLLAPKILFGYEGFSWLPLFSGPVLQGILLSMAVGAILVALGWGMRLGALIHGLGLGYFLLQEKAYYNNHIYLFVLLSFMLVFTNADRFFSIRGNRGYGQYLQRWQVFLFQLHILIVYVYGGIAKLTNDWMFRQEPMRSLANNAIGPEHWMAPMLKNELAIHVLTYGGFAIDFFAPVVLLIKPIRKWALWFFIFFHLANSQIFDDISIFPYVMVCSMLLFYKTQEVPLLRGMVPKYKAGSAIESPGKPVTWILGAYIVLQLLIPFRGYFLPNPMDYTTIGNRFAWHMKVDTRIASEMVFQLGDPGTGQVGGVDVRRFVNDVQIRHMAHDPRSVAAFARMIKKTVMREGAPKDVWVKARIRISYNGRPMQYFVDPQADLSTVDADPFRVLPWLVLPEG